MEQDEFIIYYLWQLRRIDGEWKIKETLAIEKWQGLMPKWIKAIRSLYENHFLWAFQDRDDPSNVSFKNRPQQELTDILLQEVNKDQDQWTHNSYTLKHRLRALPL